MEKREELKQVYDIFTAAWRIYKTYYPPNDLRDLERKAKARYQQETAQASRKMGENL